MEISVALPSVTHAQSLVQGLTGALEATVSFDVGLNEIRVASVTEPNRVVIRVVDVVEDWLEQRGVNSAKLSLGDRSYTLVGSGQIASPG
jgi:hypothetical protein